MAAPGHGPYPYPYRRIVLAPDKFKGSLSAADVARYLAAGLRRASADVQITTVPIADGGDGTVEAVVSAGFTRRTAHVCGPLGAPIDADFALLGDVAVVELAQAAGLALLGPGGADPLRSHTRGVGQLIGAALDAGARTIILGVGGSASTDGGAGMLAGLGARWLDRSGAPLPDGGGNLARLAAADLSGLDPRLSRTRFRLACDVDNPLLGEHGAAAVYGPQKGADAGQVAALERGLARLADVLTAALGDPVRQAVGAPGAGTAGGTGFAALAVLGALRQPGIDLLLETVGFDRVLDEADLVVTGEGALDEQTLRGKAPAGVAAAARARGLPTIAVCGQLSLDPARLHAAGIVRAYALTDLEPDVARCLAAPGPLLERIGESIARTPLG
jgi:glycerate 2-kinase